MRLLVFLLLTALLPPRGHAAPSDPGGDAAGDWPARIEAFLRPKLSEPHGQTTIRLEGAGALPACDAPALSLPDARPPWGRVRLIVRCDSPQRWTRFLAVKVIVLGPYLVTTRRINAGQSILETDIAVREGELTLLPKDVLHDPNQAIARTTRHAIAAGQPLLRDQLIQPTVIRQGDKVKARVVAAGFSAEVEAVALTSAGVGESVRVRTEAGKILIGTARVGGLVELAP